MSLSRRVTVPQDAVFFVTKNNETTRKPTDSWIRFFEGLYDMQGASSGSPQFNLRTIQSKGSVDVVGLSSPIKFKDVSIATTGVSTGCFLVATSTTNTTFSTLATTNFAHPTGTLKMTYKTTADSTWIMWDDGTIGNLGSAATTRANADTEALYTLLWNSVSNTYAPVSSGRGASAAADFAANKTLTLPKTLGRLPVVGEYQGGGLGVYSGEEGHAITIAELPAHTHTDQTLYHTYGGGVPRASGASAQSTVVATTGTYDPSNNVVPTTAAAHNNMQPTVFCNIMVKL